MSEQLRRKKFERFRSLHVEGRPVLVGNPWDAGTARLLQHAGFEALATTSAGYAFARGLMDSAGSLSRDEVIANAAEIVDATPLPVTADLENGFGHSPEACAETLRAACEAGLVGGSIEDATGDPDTPVYDLAAAVDRIAASAEAVRGRGFLLTARAENFLCGLPSLEDTIQRLQAYSDAGADVLYAPGLPDLDSVRQVCASLDKPVNVVLGIGAVRFTVSELAEAGVARISVGGSLARAAYGAVRRAAEELLRSGTSGYLDEAMPGSEIAALMER